MLVHGEGIVRRYLAKTMCDDRPPPGNFDLFAVEGGTAAMCYVFNSLVANGLLQRGDTIALGTPIFTPYLEIPQLERVRVQDRRGRAERDGADGRHTWQYPDAELAKLEDPRIKAFFLVNPQQPRVVRDAARDASTASSSWCATSGPTSSSSPTTCTGPSSTGFRSLAADLPHNTILVYSYSKHFGCTGWRLGVVALHEDNVIDETIARLPRGRARARCASATAR